jgi:hypothetical protein
MSASHSVSVRLQRVTTEAAHVSVSLTEDMWLPRPDNPETLMIDVEKLMAIAIQYGSLPTTIWRREGDAVVTPHPLQTGPAEA